RESWIHFQDSPSVVRRFSGHVSCLTEGYVRRNVYPGAIMNRPISPTAHGALDYSTMAAALAAPRVLNFPKSAALATYSLAVSYLALSALTDYPPALKRAVPLKVHGATDM